MSEPIEPAPADRPHVIRLVAAWGLERSVDRVVLRRRFGAPAGLTPRHRVALVLTGVLAAGRVTLNGFPLRLPDDREAVGDGRSVPFRFDLTGRLLHRNDLRVEGVVARDPPSQRERLALPLTVGDLRLDAARLEIVSP
jgi:hypothetical protein